MKFRALCCEELGVDDAGGDSPQEWGCPENPVLSPGP